MKKKSTRSSSKSTTSFKEFRNPKTNTIAYTVDLTKKVIQYYLPKDSRQREQLLSITMIGFERLPSGFYREGYGLTKPGRRIIRQLRDSLGEPFHLVIGKNVASSIKRIRGKIQVIIRHKDFAQINSLLRILGSNMNKDSNGTVQFYLNKFYPEFVSIPAIKIDDVTEYRKDEIYQLLEKENILENMSKKDEDRLQEFFNQFLVDKTSGATTKKKLFQLAENKSTTEIIYIQKVIEEFERMLGTNSYESTWQNFLKEYILLFNSSYTRLLEKESIALDGKFPDFMLIDLYNYLDIYEIKTPQTNLLKYDNSRGNYYWDVELGKAISQVENYIHQINNAGPLFIQKIKDKYNVDIRVIKPRGFIIVGSSTQLENQKMKDDFRLLNNSLKNLDIILYDDFLNGLKNFLTKLT